MDFDNCQNHLINIPPGKSRPDQAEYPVFSAFTTVVLRQSNIKLSTAEDHLANQMVAGFKQPWMPWRYKKSIVDVQVQMGDPCCLPADLVMDAHVATYRNTPTCTARLG